MTESVTLSDPVITPNLDFFSYPWNVRNQRVDQI